MMRAKDLGGRAVVDMDAAQKLGSVDKVILDPDARRVAGFIVTHRPNPFGNEVRTTVPASAIHAIGPDAITVRRTGVEADPSLNGLPTVSDLVGRKVVSDDGRFLGVVDDVLISGPDARIMGYTLADDDVMGKLESLVKDRKRRPPQRYLRADAPLRAGRDLIVAPEEAVIPWAEPAVPPANMPPASPAPRPSQWFQAEPEMPDVRRRERIR